MPPREAAQLPKRRHIRKGTLSCWECKRRKTRCTFASTTLAVCDGCRSRQTRCLSQEYYDEPDPASRLGAPSTSLAQSRSRRQSRLTDRLEETKAPMAIGRTVWSTHDHLEGGNAERTEQQAVEKLQNDHNAKSAPRSAFCGTLLVQTSNDLHAITRALLDAWPSESDMDLIQSLPIDWTASTHGVICVPYEQYWTQSRCFMPWRIKDLLPRDPHPVLVARHLLQLGSLLQSLQPDSVADLAGMSSDYRLVMSRSMNTVSQLVTSNDELIQSLEGVECLMMESMFLNDSGNLRRAWLTNRRAIAISQMMGLHAASTRQQPKVIDLQSLERIDPDIMWFRLVMTDRYLSLILGLPQSCTDNVFAAPDVFQQQPFSDNCLGRMESMERVMVVAAGLILQQDNAQRIELAATSAIDKMLQEAANILGPRWWMMPMPSEKQLWQQDTPGKKFVNKKAFEEGLRIMNQFAYRNLLVHLHLPYVLLPSSSHEASYDGNKVIAANASREILTGFVAFHQSSKMSAYCRGVDFVVFTASTVLCLVHIEAQRQHRFQMANTAAGVFSVLQSLQHQRLSDRALLEHVFSIMKKAADEHNDAIAQQVSRILEPLLQVEERSANGLNYKTNGPTNQPSPGNENLKVTESGLRIEIPHFGTIDISECPGKDAPSRPDDSTAEPWFHYTSALSPSTSTAGLAFGIDDWVLQGVDTALFNSLTQGIMEPTAATTPQNGSPVDIAN